VGAVLILAGRRTDGRTDMTKVTGTFRDCANARGQLHYQQRLHNVTTIMYLAELRDSRWP